MSNRLEGKVALITGTGTGIGRAAALLFAREGARVAGCDLDADTAEETVRLVTAAGGEMISTAPVDLAEAAAVSAWVADAMSQYGRIDILYNNAGYNTVGPFEDMTEDDWHRTMRNDLDVVYFPTHAVWPHMKAGGGGSIINTSSVTKSATNTVILSAHGAAKGAVAGLAPHLAFEGGPLGIRVNTISPGLTRTPQTERFITDKDIERTPLRRIGTPDDIARVALFLASDDSAFVSAADITVDGGQLAVMPSSQ